MTGRVNKSQNVQRSGVIWQNVYILYIDVGTIHTYYTKDTDDKFLCLCFFKQFVDEIISCDEHVNKFESVFTIVNSVFDEIGLKPFDVEKNKTEIP